MDGVLIAPIRGIFIALGILLLIIFLPVGIYDEFFRNRKGER
jgi:hypothetical protein